MDQEKDFLYVRYKVSAMLASSSRNLRYLITESLIFLTSWQHLSQPSSNGSSIHDYILCWMLFRSFSYIISLIPCGLYASPCLIKTFSFFHGEDFPQFSDYFHSLWILSTNQNASGFQPPSVLTLRLPSRAISIYWPLTYL